MSDIVRACFGEVENWRAERELRLSRWDRMVKRLTAIDPDRGASVMATALQVW